MFLWSNGRKPCVTIVRLSEKPSHDLIWFLSYNLLALAAQTGKTRGLHGAVDLFFSRLHCELLLYTVNQTPSISNPVPMWKYVNIHGSALGYINLRCSHVATSRFQKSSQNQWQAANSARAISVGWPSSLVRFLYIFTWFILNKGHTKLPVDKCFGNTNIKT